MSTLVSPTLGPWGNSNVLTLPASQYLTVIDEGGGSSGTHIFQGTFPNQQGGEVEIFSPYTTSIIKGQELVIGTYTTDTHWKIEAGSLGCMYAIGATAGIQSLEADSSLTQPGIASVNGSGNQSSVALAASVAAGASGTLQGGAGSAFTGTTAATAGGAGGAAAVNGGAGGATAGTTTSAGGAGGAASVTAGVGGAATAGTGAGGAGGAVNSTGGAGGASAGGVGGAGGIAKVIGGAGGAATAGTGNGGNGGNVVLQPGAGGTSSGGTAGLNGSVFVGGTQPTPFFVNLQRSTITNAGTITVAQLAGAVLYQDASGGAVTMTTPTGTAIDAAFPGVAVGSALVIAVASNHATNTSTISGGTGVTLVGSGAVTQTGGRFSLIKTGTATYDLVRG